MMQLQKAISDAEEGGALPALIEVSEGSDNA